MKFTPGWLLTIFVAFFLPLFITLGVWQLGRAQEKSELEAQVLAGQQQIQPLLEQTEPLDYQRYRLNGRLAGEFTWLLDNRTWQGQVGYEVWVPLETDSGWYLASLGWVAAGDRRGDLPALQWPEQPREWIAQGRPLSRQFVLADTPMTEAWPQVIQALEPERMARQMGYAPPGGLLQLEAGQPGVGRVIWQPSVVSETRHRGYALQWFAMALALAVMYGYAGIRPSRTASDNDLTDH
ncbi:MAG: SURF1 family protein [Saccharospirillum sp.]